MAAQVANRPLDAADSGALTGRRRGNPLFVVESVRAADSSGAIATPPRGSTPSSRRAWRFRPL
jgi:hypothetical protein